FMIHRRLTLLSLLVGFGSSLFGARTAHAQDASNPGAQTMTDGIAPSVAQRVITPPKLVQFVEAVYPEAEKAAGTMADVVLQIGIADTGQVVAVAVLEPAGPAFDAAAVAAAKQFVFEPARVNGKAIPVKIQYKYAFTITKEVVKRTTADFKGT